MTDPSGYAKTLALPAGFDAPRLLRYDDVTAHAITRDDLAADVRGINASLDLIREPQPERSGGVAGAQPALSRSSEGVRVRPAIRRPQPAQTAEPGVPVAVGMRDEPGAARRSPAVDGGRRPPTPRRWAGARRGASMSRAAR